MTLFMLQWAPDLPRLVRWAEAEKLLHPLREDDLGYALHALLRAAFDRLAPAPFALLRDAKRPAKLLAYSPTPPAELRAQAAACAEPAVVAALGLADMADKQMPEGFPVGHRLGFTVRARPTVRTDRDGNRDRVRERDAFLAAIDGTAPGEGPSRGEVYRTWLARRLGEGGAEAEHLVLDQFRLTLTLRRNDVRRLHPFNGPDATFSGVLRVTDPARFGALLAHGVGRHRAFGFGMLLLRPAPPC
jgi:CRISPR system Cascade subunit CasE